MFSVMKILAVKSVGERLSLCSEVAGKAPLLLAFVTPPCSREGRCRRNEAAGTFLGNLRYFLLISLEKTIPTVGKQLSVLHKRMGLRKREPVLLAKSNHTQTFKPNRVRIYF